MHKLSFSKMLRLYLLLLIKKLSIKVQTKTKARDLTVSPSTSIANIFSAGKAVRLLFPPSMNHAHAFFYQTQRLYVHAISFKIDFSS